MPTLDDNRAMWEQYAWPEGGEEWSKAWGHPALMWHGTIYPRIAPFLPAEHVLEIAPGYGRCTDFLLWRCVRLTIVDLTTKCIEACRARFVGHPHLTYLVNDGRSLAGVAEASVDFAFSWDSLVHADAPTMAAYVAELARTLRPGGTAFLHHSNLAACAAPSAHWRDPSMSAEILQNQCAAVGLHVLAQELVEWEPGLASDAFSLLRRPKPGDRMAAPRVDHNPDFVHEVARYRRLSDLYWCSEV